MRDDGWSSRLVFNRVRRTVDETQGNITIVETEFRLILEFD